MDFQQLTVLFVTVDVACSKALCSWKRKKGEQEKKWMRTKAQSSPVFFFFSLVSLVPNYREPGAGNCGWGITNCPSVRRQYLRSQRCLYSGDAWFDIRWPSLFQALGKWGHCSSPAHFFNRPHWQRAWNRLKMIRRIWTLLSFDVHPFFSCFLIVSIYILRRNKPYHVTVRLYHPLWECSSKALTRFFPDKRSYKKCKYLGEV